MNDVRDPADVASAVMVAIGLLHRRLRQTPVSGDLSMPQRTALSRLDRCGPMTSAALARMEQVSPQAMGATLGGLEDSGLLEREPDPGDGRRIMLSLSPLGKRVLAERRSARVDQLATILAGEFTAGELAELAAAAPLLERLADRL